MDQTFEAMLEQSPHEAWLQWESEKGNTPIMFAHSASFWEANIVIKIAQWRANEVIEKEKREDLVVDEYIKVRDMLSRLQLDNGLLFDPRDEKRILHLYRHPEPLRAIFRSVVLDTLLMIEIARAEWHHEEYLQIRHKIFPYLPPYDTTSE